VSGTVVLTTTVYDAAGQSKATVYDSAGQTKVLVDVRGNRHGFTYDPTGRQTRFIDPLNRRGTAKVAQQRTAKVSGTVS